MRVHFAVAGSKNYRCGKKIVGGTAPDHVSEADVTCPVCVKRRPKRAMSAADVERAEGIVEAKSAESLDEKSVYISVSLSQVGVRRRVETGDVVAKGNGELAEEETDHAMLHVAKDIFDAAELKAISRTQREVVGWLYRRAFRSVIRAGVHRLPLSLVEEAVGYLEKKQGEVAADVEAFIARYDDVKANARKRLGRLYDAADYPSPGELRRAFRIEYYFAALAVPGQLSGISRELYQRESAKAADRAEQERQLIVEALRAQFAQLVEHMVSMLEPGPDGKPKRFRESSVESAREFFDLFSAKNIGGDAALEPVVARAAKLLEGVDAKSLKSDKDLREKVQSEFDKVRKSLAGMVTLRATRAVKLED